MYLSFDGFSPVKPRRGAASQMKQKTITSQEFETISPTQRQGAKKLRRLDESGPV
jgi:hypothetical protein